MTKLSVSEISKETLTTYLNFKIFLISIVMVPAAMIAHLCMMCYLTVLVPNKVIDMITLAEKTKLIKNRRKTDVV